MAQSTFSITMNPANIKLKDNEDLDCMGYYLNTPYWVINYCCRIDYSNWRSNETRNKYIEVLRDFLPDLNTSLITANFKLKNKYQLLPDIILLKVAMLFNNSICNIVNYNDIINVEPYQAGNYKAYRGEPITVDLNNLQQDIHTIEALTKVYNQLKQYIVIYINKNNSKILKEISLSYLEDFVKNDTQISYNYGITRHCRGCRTLGLSCGS